MPSKVDDLVLRLEAILFASGKPMSVRELTEALGVPDHRPVQRALKGLSRAYAQRQTALCVTRVGDRYALQLREPYVPAAHAVTPVDMAPRTLKALTLIAYHQPIVQSRLVRMIGESAYEEVDRLRESGLVHAEPKGATLELTTTRNFAEQFGLASTKPEEIRKFLERRLGVPTSAPAPDPSEGAPADPEEGPAPSEAEPTPGPATDPPANRPGRDDDPRTAREPTGGRTAPSFGPSPTNP